VFNLGYALAPPAAVDAAREDSLTQLTVRTYDSAAYPHVERTGGPLDLIHVGTIARGQNKVSCRFLMNTDPTSYALVYQSRRKHDLAGAYLFDLPNYHERICPVTHDFPATAFDEPYGDSHHTIPESSFDIIPFSLNRPVCIS
jgi:hypothetical protein